MNSKKENNSNIIKKDKETDYFIQRAKFIQRNSLYGITGRPGVSDEEYKRYIEVLFNN